jgi:ClpP class serine protease
VGYSARSTREVIVLVESLQRGARRNANANRFLKTCIVETRVSETTARRAAELRRRVRRGSAVDAIVVALAGPGGTVHTGDKADIDAIAAQRLQRTQEASLSPEVTSSSTLSAGVARRPVPPTTEVTG